MGVVIHVTVRGMHLSEHAHSITKWRPTVNLATKYAEKVRSEYSMLRRNDGTTDLHAIKWSRFILCLVRWSNI